VTFIPKKGIFVRKMIGHKPSSTLRRALTPVSTGVRSGETGAKYLLTFILCAVCRSNSFQDTIMSRSEEYEQKK